MTIREAFESLSPERKKAVVAVFRTELARGWIPKESDLRAVIDAVCLVPHAEGAGRLAV